MMTKSNPRIAKIVSFVLAVICAISFAAAAAVTANAATYTQEITLRTETIVLVDRSGSMKGGELVNDILESVLISAPEATVVYFDSHKLTKDSAYNVGGNSSICEAVDAAARGGFTHIWVISDGEQWPENYSALGIYANLDVKLCLTERLDEASEKFIEELTDSLVDSNLYVYHWLDNTVEVIKAGYVPETYTIQIEIPDPVIPEPEITEPETEEPEVTEPETEELDHGNPVDGTAEPQPEPVVNQTTIIQCNHKCPECTHKCWWWLALLLSMLFTLLMILLHWLISHRGRRWFRPVVAMLKSGATFIIDASGSFIEKLKKAVRRTRRKLGKKAEAIVFADQAVVCKVCEIEQQDLGLNTNVDAALELAYQRGAKRLVIFTDGKFNVACMHHFDYIGVVVPEDYDPSGVGMLRKIADEVEVFHL